MSTKIRTLDFLPDIFRTEQNSAFLRAVLDPLVQDKSLERREGFIGSRFGGGINALASYVQDPVDLPRRSDYQLEPGVVFLKPDTSTAKSFTSYPELLDAVESRHGITDNQDRLWKESYTVFDSFVNLDMLVNFGQYYWLPGGPRPVPLTGSIDVNAIIGAANYTSPNGVVFTTGLKVAFNSDVQPSQYRNREFYVGGVGSKITLTAVDNRATPPDLGSLEYIPWSTTPWSSKPWDADGMTPETRDYITVDRASPDGNGWSRTNQWFHIDVIRATASYLGDPDYANIANADTRAQRAIIEFYSGLRLFDTGTLWGGVVDFIDTRTQDAFSQVAGVTYYYPDVKAHTDAVATVTPGPGSTATAVVATANLHGTVTIGDRIGADGVLPLPTNAEVTALVSSGVNTVITFTWSGTATVTPMSNVALVFTPALIDNYVLTDGSRVVFTADTNPAVRNRIYDVRFDSSVGGYTLTLSGDGVPEDGVMVMASRGYAAAGRDYWFNNGAWTKCQQKLTVNQEPLFDVFDNTGRSLGDNTVRPGSTFRGCRLFNYRRGTGGNDPVLDFPLAYGGTINNLGDVTYQVSFNQDTYTYVIDNVTVEERVNTGYVHQYRDRVNYGRLTGWVAAATSSVQYQLFQSNYTADLSLGVNATVTMRFDVPAVSTSQPAPVLLYLNNVPVKRDDFTYAVVDNSTVVEFKAPLVDTVVQVLINSIVASTRGHYVIPVNLARNPFNQDLTALTTADLRYHLQSIYYNSGSVSGEPVGSNNYRDGGNLLPWGSALVKHSAPIVTPGCLLRDNNYNLSSALQWGAREWVTYKNLLAYTVDSTQFDSNYDTAYMLDTVMKTIADSKRDTDPHYWSDMVPGGTTWSTASYTFNTSYSSATFALSRVYDFSSANYWGLLVYVTRVLNGVANTTLLLKDRDYRVSNTTSSVTLSFELRTGDVVTVKEYNRTWGSYVPVTPTKLGLYPATRPHITLDSVALSPTYFIVGHDGSYTKMWGEPDANGQPVDFRDRVLLEFELRIYNNLKLDGASKLDIYSYLPGYWRDTAYTADEFLAAYTPRFLNWVGQNRIDYTTQFYRSDNEWTWNYRSSKMLDGTTITTGYWRQLYTYLYDTSTPHLTPWEMLHYTDKPDWWDDYYGAAPYTSDNTLLWSDMASGYDWNNGSPRTIESAVRLDMITSGPPVDSAGNLLSPFQSVVGDYLNYSFKNNWVVGDGGPAEWSYRRSSTWPFDLLAIISTQQPAAFYNHYIDLDRYRYNTEFKQWMWDGRSALQLADVEVYGAGLAKTSYLNFIVEYVRQWGVDATAALSQLFSNLDVRLVYRAAGFTDKDLLKFYVERSSPSSKRSTLLIPDESYAVLLHSNLPFERVNYSSVVVQRTSGGWQVWGNSQTTTSFKTLQPVINGEFNTVTVLNSSVQLPRKWSNTVVYVAYGTVFNDTQSLATFLAAYGEYLTAAGCVFDTVEDGIKFDWNQMIAEMLYWSQTGWSNGSTLNLNPAAVKLTINREHAIVQPLLLRDQNFVLNQNLYYIAASDLKVTRDDNLFQVSPLNPGDTIAYGEFNLSNLEHGVVFDNVTAFNDTIYDLKTGVRHNRILTRGWVSDSWVGALNANGFILNVDDIEEWNNALVYTPGSIVTYRGRYYIATGLVQPGVTFDERLWRLCNYDRIQRGLLPNSATRSTESELYYDSNRANLENDADLLAFSLIGYRPREYMSLADLTDVSQVNVYKHSILGKGTPQVTRSFKNAKLLQGPIDYNTHEIWSIKTGEWGGVQNSNFIELQLDEESCVGNPTLVGIGSSQPVQQQFSLSGLFNWGRRPESDNVLPVVSDSTPHSAFMDAGYVHYGDVQAHAYTYYDLPGASTDIYGLHAGDYVWLANWSGTWAVFQPVSSSTSMSQCYGAPELRTVINNGNGTAVFQFSSDHNLTQYQPFGIIGYSSAIDGYYLAFSIIDARSVYVQLQANTPASTLTGTGILVRYNNMRVSQPGDIATLPLLATEFSSTRVWVDTGTRGSWQVYEKNLNWQLSKTFSGTGAASTYGTAMVVHPLLGLVVSNASLGTLYLNRYTLARDWYTSTLYTSTSGFGSLLATNGTTLFAADTVLNTVSVFSTTSTTVTLQQTIQLPIGVATTPTALCASGDGRYLYVGVSASNLVRVYVNTATTAAPVYVLATTLTGTADGAGAVVAADYYSNTVVVGAPEWDSERGRAFFYTRNSQNWEYSGGLQTFAPIWTPTAFLTVKRNSVELSSGDYTVVGGVVTLLPALQNGDIITVDDAVYTLAAVKTGSQRGCRFGTSIVTNKYGTEFLIGAPHELDSNRAEGAVYRYTAGSVKWGSITGTLGTRTATATITINGYAIRLLPTSAAATAAAIVAADINNVTATASGNQLTVKLADPKINNGISLLSIGSLTETVAAELGFDLFQNTGRLVNPHGSTGGAYGYEIAINEHDSVAITAPSDSRLTATSFDVEDDHRTVFDSNFTAWVDVTANIGAVYLYDYLGNYNESAGNYGAWVYSGTISNRDATLNTIATRLEIGWDAQGYGWDSTPWEYSTSLRGARWGETAVWLDGTLAIAGTGYANSLPVRQVVAYRNNSAHVTNWSIAREPGETVAIDRMRGVHLYAADTNTTVTTLDYFDPLQGVLPGAVASNLDWIAPVDPAQYNSPLYSSVTGESGTALDPQNQLIWGEEEVGTTWFDTSGARWVNYHQVEVDYNARWWAQPFPGSDIAVYTWMSSSQPPAQWRGPGVPFDTQRYCVEYTVDASGTLVPRYYYWVRNTNTVDRARGKTLGDSVLQSYISNPASSGIAFIAPVLPNVYALYNCEQYINEMNTVLHIGYSNSTSSDTSHTSVKLIRSNYKDDFLPGLPGITGDQPSSLYEKFLSSLCGVDVYGNVVPDVTLPQRVRSGVLSDPLQSMVVDRLLALKNYITYVNSVLIKYPVRETKNPTFLFMSGPGYDTRDYWEYVDYWEPGYSSATVASIQVATYNDLERLNVTSGTVARVLSNSIGSSEYWIYLVNSPGVWKRIGLQNGTIQLKADLWDYPGNSVGWSGPAWDAAGWDKYPFQETRDCLRAINEQLLVDDLAIERNRALIVFFEYVCSELDTNGNNLPWLNKTSFVDIEYVVRTLSTFSTYRIDNQDFLSGYIREVKPYHVTVKEFLYKYTGSDTLGMYWTDFDAPALWQSSSERYISPQIAYVTPQSENQFSLDDPVWSNPRLVDYRANWGLKLGSRSGVVLSNLTQDILAADTELPVENIEAFPYSGIVTITGMPTLGGGWSNTNWDTGGWSQTSIVPAASETIAYTGVDLRRGLLLNVIRGYNNTAPLNFKENATLTADLPPVAVMYPGRDYATTPAIRAVYDTSLFPAPREEMQLEPVMLDGMVVGINVLNHGSGYAVTPEIVVEPAVSLVPASIDTTDSTMVFTTPSLRTGDRVRYMPTTGLAPLGGLVIGSYYAVRVLSTTGNTIVVALYTTVLDADLDRNRVTLSGIVPVIEQYFQHGAILQPWMTNLPIRQSKTTFAWDRVTYRATPQWRSGAYYSPAPQQSNTRPAIAVNSITGTTVAVLSCSAEYNPATVGAHLNNLQVLYTGVGGVSTGYLKLREDITTSTAVELWRDPGFTVPVTPGELSLTAISTPATTVAGTRDITLQSVTGLTVGQPVFFTGATGSSGLIADSTYRIASINGLTVTLMEAMQAWASSVPVTLNTGGRYLLATTPVSRAPDRVNLNGTLYECYVQNRDTEFDINKWVALPQTHADRIQNSYSPTVNMPGVDITQLMSGVTYPGTSFTGNPFDSVFQVDTILTDPGWPSGITTGTVVGSAFTTGYAPEELMAGQFKEQVNITVVTDGGAPEFMISVDTAGASTVHNVGASRRTTAAAELVRTNDSTDTLVVADVTKLVYTVAYPVNSDGTVTVPSTKSVLDVGGLPYTLVNLTTIKIGGVLPASVNVTFGSRLLVNGEFIAFQRYDPAANTVSGLTRGLLNTPINGWRGTIDGVPVAGDGGTADRIVTGDVVTAINDGNRLQPDLYGVWWYGTPGSDPVTDPAANGPLTADTTNPAAIFLNS